MIKMIKWSKTQWIITQNVRKYTGFYLPDIEQNPKESYPWEVRICPLNCVRWNASEMNNESTWIQMDRGAYTNPKLRKAKGRNCNKLFQK